MAYLGVLGQGVVQYKYPTSVLALRGGGLALVEKHKLHIFDDRCRPLVEFAGQYHGLTEGENGDIFTLEDKKVVWLSKLSGRYCVKKNIQLCVLEEFDEWKRLSKPRHLLYNMGRLHVSDKGLHKLLLVDLTTGQQTASGYLGEGMGQFKRPTGMVADRMGNMLMVDEGNNRVLVYSSSGNWLRVGAYGQEGLEQPCGITVHRDCVMVVFMGKEGRGAVVRYVLEE